MHRYRSVFAALLTALVAALPATAQQVDASATGGPTVLDAPWRLHFGDNQNFAQPDFDDSQWALHRIDKDWASEGRKGYAGYAWYRMRVVLPNTSEPLALAIYPPASAVEIYIDGTLEGTVGRMRPEPAWTYLRTVYAIPVPAALHGRSVEVALRVWGAWQQAERLGGGAALQPALLGAKPDVERIVALENENRWLTKIPGWTVDLTGLCIGLFSFGLFLLQRQAREYAYAAVYLCGSAALDLLIWMLRQVGGGVPFWANASNVSDSVLLCFWLLFTWGFVGAKADRLLSVCLAAAWMNAIAGPSVEFGIIPLSGFFWIVAPMYLFLSIAVFVRLYTLARRGNRDAQLFLIPFFFSLVVQSIVSVVTALYSSGLVNFQGTMILYRGSHFDVSWEQLFTTLSYFAIGAVLVLRFARSARQEQRLRTEMEAARRVQGQLVPVDLPQLKAFTCEAAYRAASEVGGDFYQVFPQSDGSALVLMGDVSGKGLRAAMLGTLIVGAAGALAQEHLAPADMLDRLNRQLCGRTDGGFVTCLCALLKPDGALTIANAGQLPPYYNGRELHSEPGLPLGIVPEAAYPETRARLAPGEALTFLSDGVVEAQSPSGELFGFDRTRAISTRSAEEIALAALQFGQEDDITVLTLTLLPVEVAHA
ncbi:MAG TPA: SpoIIE family protein phosphatase [Terracidiphilus sp.]|nr:SpoIIE family protein phosphatase [Terracidiphilus sp.]